MSSVIPNQDPNKIHKTKSVRHSMFLLGTLAINNISDSKEYKSKILSERRRRRHIKEIKETYKKKINEHEMREIINQLLSVYKTPYDLCINALIQFPSYRNKEAIDLIKPYLKELIGLMDIVSKEKNEELSDKVLSQIALNLQYKKILGKNFICRFGEKGNHFYIILKGKIVFLVPKIIKCYLNENEYMNYLIKLKKSGENELLRNVISINRQYYDLGDDFDYFIRELIEDNKNQNKKKSPFLTPEIFSVLKRLIEEEDNNNLKNNNENNENSIKETYIKVNLQEYMERTKVDDINLNSKDRKKVNVFMYQITNYYEDGQIFGMVALESKTGKRSATAIALEDCELGLLTKEQYITMLESIHHKSTELLFNLINSYNILGLAPKKAFDNRFCHMFKCVRFKRGTKLMEENKKINSVIVFNGGEFTITVNKNILELNELVIKLHKIRGMMMGLSENAIQKELSNSQIGKDFVMNQQFILPETMKMYQKKHNLTISIVNDRLVIGLLDTVDKDSHLPLFNCTCVSKFCDGYEITNNSLDLVNKEYPCINNTNQISLINIEYFLKRLYLHMKEIESKIENFNKNLKYEIKKNKKFEKNLENLEITEKNEENKIKDEEDLEEIRRNTFEIKKKNNNEISLVQILNKSIKKDYSTKKQRFNTIDKSQISDSINNINIENKRYENIKTMNDVLYEDSKEKKSVPFIYKVKKSIQEKEHLLRLVQGKSHKYMEIKKQEMRSINMARNKKLEKNKYIDLSAIFNKNNSPNKEKSNYYGKFSINSEKKKDYILDSIINNINRKSKYERILSSYISKHKHNNTIQEKEEKEEEKKEQKEINKENNEKNESSILTIENPKSPIYRNKSLQENHLEKDIKYPIIQSHLRNLLIKDKNEPTFMIESRNIVTLDGQNSLGTQGEQNSLANKSIRRIFKRYNKIMNNNRKNKNKNLLKMNNINKMNYNDLIISNEKNVNFNKLPNIISVYNRDKVHFFDPLVLDKFNNHYINKKLKTLDN